MVANMSLSSQTITSRCLCPTKLLSVILLLVSLLPAVAPTRPSAVRGRTRYYYSNRNARHLTGTASKASKSVSSRQANSKSASTPSGQLLIEEEQESEESTPTDANIFNHESPNQPTLEASDATETSKSSKSRSKSKKSTTNSASESIDNVPSQDDYDSSDTGMGPSHAEEVASSGDYYGKPGEAPLQPVLCGKTLSIKSALLVRMLGDPSLMTRYEKIIVEQLVKDSYNDWMMGVCDGYHRTIISVEMKPIEDTKTITQAHKETLKAEESYIEQLEEQEPSLIEGKEPIYNELVQAEDLTESYRIETGSPTFSSTQEPVDIDLRYAPLYWLSLSATCRSCPRTELGNYNLLSSLAEWYRNATTSGSSQRLESMPADALIMEEVCFCPASPEARGVSNGTALVTQTVERYFPAAVAPTSKQLMELVNARILELRSIGKLTHVESLLQMTEPDYAFYALEATHEEQPGPESVQGIENIQGGGGSGEVEDDSMIVTTDEEEDHGNGVNTPSSAPSRATTSPPGLMTVPPVSTLPPVGQDPGGNNGSPADDNSMANSHCQEGRLRSIAYLTAGFILATIH